MRESRFITFLYATVAGRTLLKLLTKQAVSGLVGSFLNTRCSKYLIPGFIEKNNISLEGIEVPKGGFYSFNDFFKREKTEIFYDKEANNFISPCDGFLSMVELNHNSHFSIKNTAYDLTELLKDKSLSKEFEGGIGLVFRLTPAHYHRYIFVDDGEVLKKKRIEGILHCVRPVALAHFPVFIENTREYIELESDNFGKLIQMEVGAIVVGKITNHRLTKRVRKGSEKGYFEFGGSTIVVLVQRDKISLSEDILRKLKKGKEISVKCGECIGKRR